MQPAFFKNFPDVSLELQGVSLTDSLYEQHHHPLMDLDFVYVKFNLLSLLGGNPRIGKVTLSQGQIYLFTDSTGYSNSYLLKKNSPNKNKARSKKNIHIGNFSLENIRFTLDQQLKNKKIQVMIKQFDGAVSEKNQFMHIVSRTWLHIGQLGFNLAKGGYLMDKDFKANLSLILDRDKGQLQLPLQEVHIGNALMKLAATFSFKGQNAGFDIAVSAVKIGFKDCLSILNKHISQKLKDLDLTKDLAVQVTLKGRFASPDTPLVHADWQTVANDVKANFGVLKNASFSGSFNNEVVPGLGRGDDNSAITFSRLSANYLDIPIMVDTVRLMNLKHPLLDFDLSSAFPVARLNTALSKTFNFTAGAAELKATYHGGVLTHDSLGHSLVGSLQIKNAAFSYVPHDVHFSDGYIDLVCNGSDLIINKSTLSTGKSDIVLSGIAKQFMNVYFEDPRKAVFDWKLHSDTLNLQEFKGLTQVKGSRSAQQQRRQYHKVNERIALLMEKSTMTVHASVDRLFYSSFSARNVKGVLKMNENSISLSPLTMQFADGSLEAALKMDPDLNEVGFELDTRLQDINTSKLFYNLENFGQSTLSYKNISGDFNGRINIKGKLNDQSDIVKKSLSGKVQFSLKKGELINFAPFETIQKFVFKNRNLSHIYFEPVTKSLSIAAGKVDIPHMDIKSTAINLSLMGTYAFGPGTDIGIEVPLRNPEKTAQRAAKGLPPRKGKGIVLYLRARDDKDGNVKIVWDPLHKGPSED